jgi:hypothetical protein
MDIRRDQHRQFVATAALFVMVALCALGSWLTDGQVIGSVVWAALLAFLVGYYVRVIQDGDE